MTPPPIMMMEGGRAVASRSSVEVTQRSAPGISSRAGSAPVAIRILSAVNVSPSTSTDFGPVNRAIPCRRSALATDTATASRNWLTMPFLRSTIRDMAIETSPAGTSIPNSAASFTSRAVSADRQNVFVGMQPQFRQVPPSCFPSISRVLSPWFTAQAAAG